MLTPSASYTKLDCSQLCFLDLPPPIRRKVFQLFFQDLQSEATLHKTSGSNMFLPCDRGDYLDLIARRQLKYNLLTSQALSYNPTVAILHVNHAVHDDATDELIVKTQFELTIPIMFRPNTFSAHCRSLSLTEHQSTSLARSLTMVGPLDQHACARPADRMAISAWNSLTAQFPLFERLVLPTANRRPSSSCYSISLSSNIREKLGLGWFLSYIIHRRLLSRAYRSIQMQTSLV